MLYFKVLFLSSFQGDVATKAFLKQLVFVIYF